MSTETPDFVMSTFIRCAPDALWDSLMDPEAWSRFHFMPGRISGDGDVLRFARDDGTPMLVCRRLEAEPKSRLVTTFEPKWADIPPSRVVYLIAQEGAHCRLTLAHYGLSFPVVPGEGIADGWERTLAGLKTWLESGQGVRFAAPADAEA